MMASATWRDAPVSAGSRCSMMVRQSTDRKRADLSILHPAGIPVIWQVRNFRVFYDRFSGRQASLFGSEAGGVPGRDRRMDRITRSGGHVSRRRDDQPQVRRGVEHELVVAAQIDDLADRGRDRAVQRFRRLIPQFDSLGPNRDNDRRTDSRLVAQTSLDQAAGRYPDHAAVAVARPERSGDQVGLANEIGNEPVDRLLV